jgi:2-polyprenyl-3-methyl-5-hydroxy-6-metoxy-1,4-benzoquinol methylase
MLEQVLGAHFRSVSEPRAERIAKAFAKLAPLGAKSLLDIGCGDGVLATRVGALTGTTTLAGVDIKAQPNCHISVQTYNGLQLPFESSTFDIVTISDVLHHAEDPGAVLKEALRVVKPSGGVLIKDHFRFGPVSNAVLLAMDVIGNYAQGIFVRGTYFSPSTWIDLVSASGGAVDELLWPFEVHSLPWRVVTRSELQFVARVRRRDSQAR